MAELKAIHQESMGQALAVSDQSLAFVIKRSGAAQAARLQGGTRGLAPFGYYCLPMSK